MSIQKYYRK